MMKLNNTKLNNQKGMTLVEILVALGLSSMALYMIIANQLSLQKQTKELQEKVEDRTSQTIAERMLIYDLNNLDVVFNNISVKDDDGYEFFDYYSDVPLNLIVGKTTRRYTMDLNKGKKEIVFVTGDISTGGSIIIDPVAAYKVGPTPNDFNEAASLTFVSINQNSIVGKTRPQLWRSGQLVLLDTPAKVRAVKQDGTIDLSIPGRSPIFVGYVSGQSLSSVGSLSSLFKTTHPETGQAINSADVFFRTLPPIGGGQPLARLHGLKVVKYYIEEMQDKKGEFRLFRTTMKDGKFGSPAMLLDGLTSVEFTRNSVTQKLITFKFLMPKKLYTK